MDLRLERVAEYVVGDSVCDVGCDHGKLCAELLISGKVKKAYGIDISEQSLNKSKELKAKERLDAFELLAGDGFEPVVTKNVECGVICGIGSNEVIGIIDRQLDFVKSLKRLILCPLKNTYLVREYLLKNGFEIDEDMVFERGRYYNIFICRYDKEKEYDDVDVYVGRSLVEKKHPLIREWLEKRVNEMKSNLSAYDDGVKTERTDKRDNMVRMYNAYKRGLELCE